MDWRTEMHWESSSVDSLLEDDERLASKLAMRLRRRKGEDGTVLSTSPPPPKSVSDVLPGRVSIRRYVENAFLPFAKYLPSTGKRDHQNISQAVHQVESQVWGKGALCSVFVFRV